MAYFDEVIREQTKNFIRNGLKTENGRFPNVVIAYHGDGDGCCSAYFMSKFLGMDCAYYWVATAEFDFEKAQNDIEKMEPDFTVFLDMPVDNRPQMLKALAKKGRVFVYDHHESDRYAELMELERLLYINPRVLQNGPAYPTALFVRELLEENTEFADEILFMALFTESWLDRLDLFTDWDKEKIRILKGGGKRMQTSFLSGDSPFFHLALNYIKKAETVGSITDDEVKKTEEFDKLDRLYRSVQEELERLHRQMKSEIGELAEPNYILKRVESRYHLCGLVASGLRREYPHLAVAVWQKWKDRYHCELRRGENCRINLVSLIDFVKRKTRLLTGGGHPPAAGYTARKAEFFKSLELFKEYIYSVSS
jgi:single-stranded DNA-specific DHH superfamily exonuclease